MAHFEMDTAPKKTRTSRTSKTKTTESSTIEASPSKRKRAPKLQVVRETDLSKAVELRKATQALSMRNVSTSNDFTFLQRKLYNTLLQFAQQRPESEAVHDIPIKKVEEHVGHTTTNSRDYLKKVLKSMTQVQVEFDYKGDAKGRKSEWGIANLIAEAYILDDNQTVRFSFPAEMKRRLLDPEMFNLIDLRMQYHFSSFSALTLHEIVSRYFGSPYGETYRAHWTEWSVSLSGSATPHAEFRDFNKMLGRAIEQVNSIESRFRVAAQVTKLNRKMDQLWFKLETLKQPGLGLNPTPELVSPSVAKRLKALSLSGKDIEELGMNFDEEYLLAQADYTEGQIKKEPGKIASPAAYFKSAVQNNYAKAPTNQNPSQPKKPASPKADVEQPGKPPTVTPQPAPGHQKATLLEQWGAAQREKIRSEFNGMDEEGKIALVKSYEAELRKDEAAFGFYKKKGLHTMVVNCIVQIIFAERFPETPSSDVLLDFVLSSSNV